MDAEHRHELKTNELADWIAHLPEFWKKNKNQIIGAILIIAAVISYFGFKNRGQRVANELQADTTTQMQTIDQGKFKVINGAMTGELPSETGLEDTATMLADAAKEAKQPQHAALALIKQAEALRVQLHYAIEDIDKEKIVSQIEMAKAAYDEALIKAEGNSTLTAMATYGLGLCQEELGEFDAAAEIFKGIATDEAFAGTIFPAKAQYRLDTMDDNKKQFTFVKAPVIAPIPGYDKEAMDAVIRGDIYREPPPVEKKKPDTVTPPAEKPDAVTPPAEKPDTVTPPAEKPDAETKTDDTETEKVYDVGPKPPEKTDTE